MGHANGARFVGSITQEFYTNDSTSSKSMSITHNITDYAYAIFFTPRITYSSSYWQCVMGCLSPEQSSLSGRFELICMHDQSSDQTIAFPFTTVFLSYVSFTMSETKFTVTLSEKNARVYNLWLFVY